MFPPTEWPAGAAALFTVAPPCLVSTAAPPAAVASPCLPSPTHPSAHALPSLLLPPSGEDTAPEGTLVGCASAPPGSCTAAGAAAASLCAGAVGGLGLDSSATASGGGAGADGMSAALLPVWPAAQSESRLLMSGAAAGRCDPWPRGAAAVLVTGAATVVVTGGVTVEVTGALEAGGCPTAPAREASKFLLASTLPLALARCRRSCSSCCCRWLSCCCVTCCVCWLCWRCCAACCDSASICANCSCCCCCCCSSSALFRSLSMSTRTNALTWPL
mmetsp:Transcript_12863/g.34244  ORF Transcript_12863/g.34244 Transcript_12863/m.34244 type:complete len:274 (+) Transcript_12863:402-1223(+)